MHAMIDDLEQSHRETSTPPIGDELRAHVLGLTSTLRADLDQLAGARADATVTDALREVGREIVAAASRAQLAALVRSAEGFCDLALGAQEAPATIDGLLHAVGLIERVLDGCLEGLDQTLLARLCHTVSARELRLGDDEDPDAIDLALDAAPDAAAPATWERDGHGAAARSAQEQELLDAFAAEALDALDQCEDLVLRAELEPADRGRLDDVAADLRTIRDAGAAVGVHDLDAPASGATVDALLECIDAARQCIEDAWADSDAATVDPAALLPFDELFLRLRRAARDVARRHGCLIELETQGGEVRLTAALADRIYEPVAQMVADAAAHAAADARRTLRLRAERDRGLLSLAVDPVTGDEALGAGDRPEALYWIDARRAATDDEVARLVYRPGSVNVVQVITG